MTMTKILTYYIDIWNNDISNTKKHKKIRRSCKNHGTIAATPDYLFCPKCGAKLTIENYECNSKVRFSDFQFSYRGNLIMDIRDIHALFYEYDDECGTRFTKYLDDDHLGAINISPREIELCIEDFKCRHAKQIEQIENYFGCNVVVKFGIINIK